MNYSFPTAEPAGSPGRASPEPNLKEILAITALTVAIFVIFVCAIQNYLAKVDDFGDSLAYMTIASAIRRWNFAGLVILQFWGLPYLMAALSIIAGISDRTSLLAICFASALVSVVLAHKLWGGWIAGFFAVLNFDWLQRSLLGGSESLFVALIFGAFLAVRRGRWMIASLLAALATSVRPLGLIALVAISVTLLWRQEFVKFAWAITIELAVGTLYALPLMLYFGGPMANVHGYNSHGHVLGFPFYAIINGTVLYSSPWTNLMFTFAWILFALAGNIAMFTSGEFRLYWSRFPVEGWFAVLYLLAIYCYNYPFWARGSFPRFVIPAVPVLLLALSRWIPRDRRVLWTLATLSPLLAAVSATGIQSAASFLRRILT